MEIRTILNAMGGKAARRGQRQPSSTTLTEMASMCLQARAFEVPPGTNLRDVLADWLLADLAFHIAIFKAAGNARAIRVLQDTRSLTQMFGHRTDHPAAWADPAAFAEQNFASPGRVRGDLPPRSEGGPPRHGQSHAAGPQDVLARYDWLKRQTSVEHALAEDFPESMRARVRDIEREKRRQTNRPRIRSNLSHFELLRPKSADLVPGNLLPRAATPHELRGILSCCNLETLLANRTLVAR